MAIDLFCYSTIATDEVKNIIKRLSNDLKSAEFLTTFPVQR